MFVTEDIRYIGVNDHDVDLFEGQYTVENGMSYNSYVILDEKVAVMDTVDAHFGVEWLQNLETELNGRRPDYLVVQHMEPDHSANIAVFMETYPEAQIVSSAKAFVMMQQFFGTDFPERKRLLATLLRRLCEIEGLHWIRVHYVYPDEIDDELIDVIASEPKIVKYLDIPLQHCNSEILKRMNRRGDGPFIKALLAKLRDRIPGLVIRTSLITGLPGEGEAQFQELCDFLRETKMERVGAFAFSPEEGTPAAKMEFVDTEIARQRAETIEMIQSEIMDEWNASMVGKTLEVLVDGYDEENEQFYGRSYADSPDIDGRVWIASDEPVTIGDFVWVKIDGCLDGDLSGYVVEEAEQ